MKNLVREKREEILKIAAKHGAYNVRVFGSFARDEADEKSDVDFLIEAGPERTPWFPGGLIVDLEELLGRKVDVVTEKGLRQRIKDCVDKRSGSFMRDDRAKLFDILEAIERIEKYAKLMSS